MFVVNAPVAQLDRVLGYEPNGREFESLRVHHKDPVERQFIWTQLGFYIDKSKSLNQ